jgi:hypothetical protein
MSPLGKPAKVCLLYQPWMIDDDDYGAVVGMRIGRGNRSTRRKPAPVPLCPPQIPHDLTWDRTRGAAVGSQRLTAWAMARPCISLNVCDVSNWRLWKILWIKFLDNGRGKWIFNFSCISLVLISVYLRSLTSVESGRGKQFWLILIGRSSNRSVLLKRTTEIR